MKSLFVTLFVSILSFVFAEDDNDKLEVGCRPCQRPNPCPERCPEATALEAARLLVNNLCMAFDYDNLALVQGGVATKSASYQTIRSIGGTCVDSGSVNFITAMIPLLGPVSCPSYPIINSSYMDSKGRVIVFATQTWVVNSIDVVMEARYLFEPVDGVCGFRLVDYYSRDISCIPDNK